MRVSECVYVCVLPIVSSVDCMNHVTLNQTGVLLTLPAPCGATRTAGERDRGREGVRGGKWWHTEREVMYSMDGAERAREKTINTLLCFAFIHSFYLILSKC